MYQQTTTHGYEITQLTSGRCNTYLIRKGNTCVLVDTSVKNSLSQSHQSLMNLGLDFNSISYLILTHTHFDHCQSAKAIQKKSDCKVVVSKLAELFVQKGFTPLPKGTNAFTKAIARLEKILGERLFSYEPFEADILIDNNEVLQINDSAVQILATPGHSSDSISIIVDNEIALVGDVMVGIFKKSIFPPFADDVPQMIQSWKKLLQTNCHTFLPGHGSKISRELLQHEYEKYKTTTA